MSSVVILLLFLLLAAPALAAFLRQDLGWKTSSFYGLVTMGLLAWHIGFSVGPVPDLRSIARPPVGALEGSRCEQALRAAERGQIVLDRSNPDRMVVRGQLWEQLPEDVRRALAECASLIRPADRRGEPVGIVTR